MRPPVHLLPVLLAALAALPAGAAGPAPGAPTLDPNRLINASYGFLKNREPEMTATEYALYDKVVSMITTRPDYAMKLLETLLGDKQPVSPAFEFVLGNAHYSGGNHARAIEHYRRAVEKHPEFVRAWTNLAIAYYAATRYADAVPCFTRAISLGDNAASTYGLLAFCQAKTGSPLAAEIAYLQAYTIDPGNLDWIQGLVELYLGSRQFARAEALGRELVRLQPSESRHWLQHANLLLAQDRPIDAVAVLETATRLGRLENDGLLLLGDLYAQQGFHPEAVAVYERALAAAPDTAAQRLIQFAQSLVALRQLDAARAILAKVPANPGGRDTAILLLETRAALAFAAQDWPATRQALEDILALDAFHGRALLGLGELCRTAGENTRARLVYEQAAQLPDFAYQANLELANLALDAKDYRRCAAHLRHALDLQRSPALQEYLARVTALLPAHEN